MFIVAGLGLAGACSPEFLPGLPLGPYSAALSKSLAGNWMGSGTLDTGTGTHMGR